LGRHLLVQEEPLYLQPGREYVSDFVFSDQATDWQNSVKQ